MILVTGCSSIPPILKDYSERSINVLHCAAIFPSGEEKVIGSVVNYCSEKTDHNEGNEGACFLFFYLDIIQEMARIEIKILSSGFKYLNNY